MKTLYLILFLANIFGLIICIRSTYRSKNELAPSLRAPISSALFPMIFIMVVTSAPNETIANIGYSVFCASINWVLYNFLIFTGKLTSTRPHMRVWKYIAGCFIGTDCMILLLNPVTGTAFDVYARTFENGETFYLTSYAPYFYAHLTISYVICVIILALLVVKMVRTPVIYWWKYLTVLISFFVIVIWDGVTTFLNTYINLSCIGYAFAGFLITIFTLAVKPYFLVDRMLRYIVEDLDDMIIFYDLDLKCIYCNDNAKQFFHVEDDNLDGTVQKGLAEWIGQVGDLTQDSLNVSRMVRGRNMTLNFELHNMKNRTRPIGSFLRIQDQTEYQTHLAKERYLATHDALTGLYSRAHLLEKIDERLQTDRETEYILVSSDIRDFKLINDIFGKEAGDRVLIRIADRIHMFATEKALYGRIGSDKFGLLMEKSHFTEDFFIEQPKEVTYVDTDQHYPVICHIGIIDADPSLSAGILFDRCNIAIQKIKNDFEKRVSYYDDEMRKEMLWEKKVTGELEDAIAKEEFVPFLQPQIDRGGNLKGAEVLVRWQHPTEGLLAPGRFIEIFEKNGMIAKLDVYVWEQACRLLASWQDTDLSDIYLSVNISPRDFYFLDICQTFTGLVDRYGIDPKMLHLEITETVMMTDVSQRSELLDRLHAAGFNVEMDDFGSGFSSLSVLKDTEVDVLKLDMGFLRQSANSERSKQILLFVINLAGQLHVPVICEGVETKEQLDFLMQAGCDMFQGYYFSKPVDVNTFLHKLIPDYLGTK